VGGEYVGCVGMMIVGDLFLNFYEELGISLKTPSPGILIYIFHYGH
jgi:hypothetical protein